MTLFESLKQVPEIFTVTSENQVTGCRSRFVSPELHARLISAAQVRLADAIVASSSNETMLMATLNSVPHKWVWERTDSVMWLPALDQLSQVLSGASVRVDVKLRVLEVLEILLVDALAESAFHGWDALWHLIRDVPSGISLCTSAGSINLHWRLLTYAIRVMRRHPLLANPRRISRQSPVVGGAGGLGLSISLFVVDINSSCKSWMERIGRIPPQSRTMALMDDLKIFLQDTSFGLEAVNESMLSVQNLFDSPSVSPDAVGAWAPSNPFKESLARSIAIQADLRWSFVVRILGLEILTSWKPRWLTSYLGSYPQLINDCVKILDSPRFERLTREGDEPCLLALQYSLEFVASVVRDSTQFSNQTSRLIGLSGDTGGPVISALKHLLSHHPTYERLIFSTISVVGSKCVSVTDWGVQGAVSSSNLGTWLPECLAFLASDGGQHSHVRIALCRLVGSVVDSGAVGFGQTFRDALGFQIAAKRLEEDLRGILAMQMRSDSDTSSIPLQEALARQGEWHTRAVLIRSMFRMVELCFQALEMAGVGNAGNLLEVIEFNARFVPSIKLILDNPGSTSVGTVAITTSVLSHLISHEPVSTVTLIREGIVESLGKVCKDADMLASPEGISSIAQCISALCVHSDGEKEIDRIGDPLCSDLIPAFANPTISAAWTCNNQLVEMNDLNAGAMTGASVDELIRNRPGLRERVVKATVRTIRDLEIGFAALDNPIIASDILNTLCRFIETICGNLETSSLFVREEGLAALLKIGSAQNLIPPHFTNVVPSHGVCRIYKLIAQQSYQVHSTGQAGQLDVMHEWALASAELAKSFVSDFFIKLAYVSENPLSVVDLFKALSPLHLLLHTVAAALKDTAPSTNPRVIELFNVILKELTTQHPQVQQLTALVGEGGKSLFSIISAIACKHALTDPKAKADDERELRRRLREDRIHAEAFFSVYGETGPSEEELVRGLWMVVRGFLCQVARVINYPTSPRQSRRGIVGGAVSVHARIAAWYIGTLANESLDIALETDHPDQVLSINEAVDLLCRVHVEDRHHMTRSMCIDLFYKQGGVDKLMKVLDLCCKRPAETIESIQGILWWTERTTSLKRMHNSQLTFLLQRQADALTADSGCIYYDLEKFDAVSLVSSIQHLFAKTFLPHWRNDACMMQISSKASASLLKAFTHVLEPNEKVLRPPSRSNALEGPPANNSATSSATVDPSNPSAEEPESASGLIASWLRRATDVGSIWRRGNSEDDVSYGWPSEPNPSSTSGGILTSITSLLGGSSAAASPASSSDRQLREAVSNGGSIKVRLTSYVGFTQVVQQAKLVASDFMDRTLVLGSSANTSAVAAQTHIADVCVRLSHNRVLKLGNEDEELVRQLQELSDLNDASQRPRDRTGTIALSADDMNELMMADEEVMVDTRTRRIDEIDQPRLSASDLASVETDGQSSTGGVMTASGQMVPVPDFSVYNTRHIAAICCAAAVAESSEDARRRISCTVLACILHARSELILDVMKGFTESVASLIAARLHKDRNADKSAALPAWLNTAFICTAKLIRSRPKETENHLESLISIALDCVSVYCVNLDPHCTEAILRLIHEVASLMLQSGLDPYPVLREKRAIELFLRLPDQASFEGIQSISKFMLGVVPANFLSHDLLLWRLESSIYAALGKTAGRGIRLSDILLVLNDIPHSQVSLGKALAGLVCWSATDGRRRGSASMIPEDDEAKRRKLGIDDIIGDVNVCLLPREQWTRDLRAKPTSVPDHVTEIIDILAKELLVQLKQKLEPTEAKSAHCAEDIIFFLSTVCKEARGKWFVDEDENSTIPLLAFNGVADQLAAQAYPLLVELVNKSRSSADSEAADKTKSAITEANKLIDRTLSLLHKFANPGFVANSVSQYVLQSVKAVHPFGKSVLLHKALSLSPAQLAPELKRWALETPDESSVETVEGLVSCLELLTRPQFPDEKSVASPVISPAPISDEIIRVEHGSAAPMRGILQVVNNIARESDRDEAMSPDSSHGGGRNRRGSDDSSIGTQQVRPIIIVTPPTDAAQQFPRFYSSRRRGSLIPHSGGEMLVEEFVGGATVSPSLYFGESVVSEPVWSFDQNAVAADHPLITRSHTGSSTNAAGGSPALVSAAGARNHPPPTPPRLDRFSSPSSLDDFFQWLVTNAPEIDPTEIDQPPDMQTLMQMEDEMSEAMNAAYNSSDRELDRGDIDLSPMTSGDDSVAFQHDWHPSERAFILPSSASGQYFQAIDESTSSRSEEQDDEEESSDDDEILELGEDDSNTVSQRLLVEPAPEQQSESRAEVAPAASTGDAEPTGISAIAEAARRYGISDSEFIRITGIDPSVLRDLPEDMHSEIVREYVGQLRPGVLNAVPISAPAPPVDNATFLSTITQPDLREEIMLTADEAFIQSLPPALHAEAILLRERISRRRRPPRIPPMRRFAPRAEDAAEIRSITDLFTNVNDGRLTVRQLGNNNNVAALHVSAPSDSVEMAQLIEMLTGAAATAPRGGNNRMMMLQPNDLRRVLMNAAGGRGQAPPTDGVMMVDSAFPPLQSSAPYSAPRISAETVDKVCAYYDTHETDPILPPSAIPNLLRIMRLSGLSPNARISLENLLCNLSLQRELRELILDQLLEWLESVSTENLSTCEGNGSVPESALRAIMVSRQLSVCLFLLTHIPLSLDWAADRVNRFIALLRQDAETNRILFDILHVLLVPLRDDTPPTTRRHRQKGHADSKVDRVQNSLNDESVNILIRVVFGEDSEKSAVGEEVVTALSENTKHKSVVRESLSSLLMSTAVAVRETLHKTPGGEPTGSAKLLRVVKVVKKFRQISLADQFTSEEVFGSPDMQGLWKELDIRLTVCERSMEEKSGSQVSKLFTLIEAFVIAHETPHAPSISRSGTPSGQALMLQRSVSVSPAIDKVESQLSNFAERHRKCINALVREKPDLLNGSFDALITHCPWTLDFDNKRTYFRSKLKEKASESSAQIRMSVRRSEVFMDSYYQLRLRSGDEMRGKLSVQFTGEEGVDAGGLLREWFGILAREIFNPNYALFRTAGGKASTFHPNPTSFVNPDHLSFFHFCGRIMGKALYEDQRLDAYFTRSFYKHMLGSPVTWMDFEVEDPDYYKQLQWILNTDLSSPETEAVAEHMSFTVDVDEFGHVRSVDLVPGGASISVTESNKREYVRLVCEYKMTTSITPQVKSFLKGFHELIPAELIGSLFDDKELELLISGLPTIDLGDLRANTEFVNYTSSAPQIQWLWKVLEQDFSKEQLAWFLQFVTGSTQVPLEGFKALMGMRGPQRFSIHRAYGSDRLPTAHTCFNQLDLPEYEHEDTLREKLLQAVTEAHEGFGFI